MYNDYTIEINNVVKIVKPNLISGCRREKFTPQPLDYPYSLTKVTDINTTF